MRLKALPALLLVAGISLAAYGCTATNAIEGTPLVGEGDDGGAGDDGSATGASSSGGSSSGGSCTPAPPADLNPSTLPSCCTVGAAHCVPTEYVPSADKAALASCSGGYCVPDPFITNPNYVPPSCNAFNNTPGVCLSLCVPQVEQYKSILTQGTCAATELCAPCTNPLTNMPSGACAFKPPGQGGGNCSADGGASGSGSSGSGSGGTTGDGGAAPEACPYKGPPIIDPSTLPACGAAGTGAHCLQAALVPMAMQSQLATCTGGYCVPDVFIEAAGNYIPPTCSSLDGAEGRCLNVNIPQVSQQESMLPQATCQSYERCVPCFSPIDGTKTGACNLSCDPGPSKPIVLFPSCCQENGTDEGRCVPSTIISSTEQKNLDQDSCNNKGDLCVPSEMLSSTGSTSSFKPPTCTATGFLVGQYSGVCLSKCLSFGIQGIALAQGTCDDIHTCAPCTNPLTGQPSGAPGCP